MRLIFYFSSTWNTAQKKVKQGISEFVAKIEILPYIILTYLYIMQIKTLLALLLLPFLTQAQYYINQNKIWAFGTNAGLDFTLGSPVSIHTSINTPEGCATVCSPFGDLLFYTDGKTVYNRMGNVMPSGASIVPFNTNSTEQAALIIPVIGTSTQYYLFSLSFASAFFIPNFCKLVYCKVDMTLDGGLGDIVAGSANTSIEDSLGENMIAITGNNNNIWLVTHRRDTALFLSYNITSAGVGSPVTSSPGGDNGWGCHTWGMLRASPNRRKIAQSKYKYSGCYGTDLFDFDPNTGIVSNRIIVDTSLVFGVEFSPDNSKLYTTAIDNSDVKICQYDISLSTSTAILSSRYKFSETVASADLRLGPDSKIYFHGRFGYVGCINSPNLLGASSNFNSSVFPLASGTSFGNTLPNLYVISDTANALVTNNIVSFTNTQIFPSPTTENITISTGTTITTIELINILGQIVCTATPTIYPQQATFSISHLPIGVYIARVNGIIIGKVVKQ